MVKPIRRSAAAGLVVLLAAVLVAGGGGTPATADAVLYEAELATIVNGAVASNHPGFTGTGFVDSANVMSAAVQFSVNVPAAGSYTLTFRYANGVTANRTSALAVNGVATGTLPFAPTGSWETWRTEVATRSLASGSNTVRITATTSGGLPNVDSLTVDAASTTPPADIIPSLAPNLVAFYDFEHPAPGNAAVELDRGPSGTRINLINGGASMRVNDGAYPRSTRSIQLKQVRPTVTSNDDWKAGVYSTSGVTSLNGFSHVQGITIMGWFKMTGQNPSPNSNTSNPSDFYGAVGFTGILSGDSNGHPARALIELFNVNGKIRLSVLGRRLDPVMWQVFAANEDWHTLLPQNTWVFLAATLNYNNGTMALYRNGQPLAGFYGPGDPWGVGGGGGPFFTSATNPRGIKIGGSFPQNNRETNPCNCRMDGLMFLNRDATADEVAQQYALLTTP